MKGKKTILALVLIAVLLCTMFAACTKPDSANNTPSTSTEPTTPDPTPSQTNPKDDTPVETTEPTTPSEPAENEEPTEIVWRFYDLRMVAADYGEHVWEAVNELLERKINVHATIQPVIAADYNSAFNLSIAGGEEIDMVGLTGRLRCAAAYSNSQIQDITDMLAEYAPDANELTKDYTGAFTYNDRLYAVPTIRNLCTNGYICMRKDLLEGIGMVEKAQNMETWSEFEEILAAATEKYVPEGIYAISKGAQWSVATAESGAFANGDRFEDTIVYDSLGDTLFMIASDMDGHVFNVQDTQYYVDECKRVRDWFEKGWVYPDAGLTDVHGDELIKQGVGMTTIQNSEAGVEITKGAAMGYELICKQWYTGMLSTSTLATWGIAIPVTAEEPEAALKVINLLYTDPELMNLIMWGVEGVDYNIVDGQVKHIEEGHYYESDFMIGNNTLLTPLYGNGVDYYEKVKISNAAATRSPYMGFAMDTSDLDQLIGTLNTVRDEFRAQMNCGAYTDEGCQNYLSKLKAAGIDDYVGAFQSQLDAWLAAR